MPRKPRCLNTSHYFHVMVQGINKEKIFIQDSFKLKYLKSIQEKKDEFNIEILAYCIMQNHAHILLFCNKNDELTGFMKCVNTTFSENYNKKNSRSGYVFRDRYKSEPITDETYLRNCLVYIHRNPVKAKIVDKYEEYNFSSYNEYINKFKIISDKTIDLVFFGNKDYKNLFKEYHKKNVEDEFIEDKIDLKEFLNAYLEEKNLKFSDLVGNSNNMVDFIKKARILTVANMREIASILNISRAKCYRLLKS